MLLRVNGRRGWRSGMVFQRRIAFAVVTVLAGLAILGVLSSLATLQSNLKATSQIRRSLIEKDVAKPIPPEPHTDEAAGMPEDGGVKPAAIQSGQPWLDTEGHLIQAHGGGAIFHEGIYYWFGEHKGGATYERKSQSYHPPRVDVIGVSCYSSADLLHWQYEGLALNSSTHPDIRPENVLERPKVLFNRATNTFVMWMHVDTEDYEWARIGVATAASVSGPYNFLRSWRPHNQHSRDFTVFKDDDEKAYVAYSSEDNSVLHLAELTGDYQNINGGYKRVLIDRKREAPALFRFQQYYLLLTSGCTGWAPNRPELFYTKDILGQWESLGNPYANGQEEDRAYGFYSQSTFVLQLEHLNGSYVVMLDQWNTDDLSNSRYAWLPLWLEELPQDDHLEAMRMWALQHAEKKSSANWDGYWHGILPAPLHAMAIWLDSWSPEVLANRPDEDLRQQHLTELRTFPEREDGTFDVGQDALYGLRLKDNT